MPDTDKTDPGVCVRISTAAYDRLKKQCERHQQPLGKTLDAVALDIAIGLEQITPQPDPVTQAINRTRADLACVPPKKMRFFGTTEK